MVQLKRTTFVREYFRLFMGLLMCILGSLIVSHTLSSDDFSFLFSAVLIIFGGIMVAMGETLSAIIGILILITGGSLILDQAGIIPVPYGGAIIGWLFMGFGVLIIITYSARIIMKWRDKGPHEDDEDDLDDVDY